MGFRRALPMLEGLAAEANAVTATGTGHQFEIQLGHLCNNRCVFCSSGQLSAWKVARPIPLAPVVEALERARASGARRVTFLGGEPTIHKQFPAALARAAALGFEEIVVFTNGVMFPHPGFIASVAALGPSVEWRVSIQGGDEAAHVAVTGRADSFRRIERGLRELRERGQRVTANACVNAQSYRALPGYVDLARDHGLAQLHLDVVRPSSTGQRDEAEMRAMMPRYTEMAPWFRAMLERFERELPGFDVNIGNLPFCVLPDWSDRIHHGGDETVTQSCDAEGLEVAVNKYDWHFSMRTHPEGCAGCTFRPQCSGVYREYLTLHGDAEFRAISADALRTLDPSRRAFSLLAGPWVDTLLPTIANAGWPARSDRRDPRKRAIDLDLGAATLRLRPPGTLPRADAHDFDFDLDLDLDPEAAPDARDTLLDVLGRALAGRGTTLDREAVTARHAAGRARRRAVHLAAALGAMGPARGWYAHEARDEGTATVLPLHGGGAAIEVVLSHGVRAGRSAVDVDFRIADDTPTARARPLVDKVIRTLEGLQRVHAGSGCSSPAPNRAR